MAKTDETNTTGNRSTTELPRAGSNKLDQLKAELFPAETRSQRVACALAALQRARRKSNLDAAALKYIAQDTDLEGD